MDATERRRAAAFAFEHLRRRYIAAHVFLRSVLGRAIGIAGSAVRFGATEHGKPYLLNAASIVFNMSHAEGVAYLAIADAGALGIDVELHHRVDDLMGIARIVFSPVELELLERESREAQIAAFLRCWTRKEAYVKASGVGLGAELRAITVYPSDAEVVVPPIDGVSDVPFYVHTIEGREGEYVAIASTARVDAILRNEFDLSAA